MKTPPKVQNAYQRREEDYVHLTPLSPIKLSFVMDEKTPQTEIESVEPDNKTFVVHFVELLQSDSDIVKFEAASSLLHILNAENATVGKNRYFFHQMNLIHNVLTLFYPCYI